MLLVLRALLVLGLAMPLHTARKGQPGSLNLGKGTRLGKAKMGRLVLDPTVNIQTISMSSSTIANMSLSPWTYRDSYQESRLPQRISHAQCLTSGCLSLQGGGEDAALEAMPIYYQVLVLHRVQRQRENKKGGKRVKENVFRLGTEQIIVGCTCVRPTVVPQQ